MPGTAKTLLLTLQYDHRASYYDDWLDAFRQSPHFECTVLNLMRLAPSDLAAQIEEYDLIILMHAAISDTFDYLQPVQIVLADRKRAKLLSFVGNEFNSPYIPLSGKAALLQACRVDVIATQLLVEAGEYIYADRGAKVVSVPHALNPLRFNADTPYEQRSIDVGMLSYRYPPYLGDNDRNRIIDYFSQNARDLGLQADIDTNRRLVPTDWTNFLANCRSVLATETGSWYLSPDDTLAQAVNKYAESQRSGIVISEHSPLRRLARHLPAFIKSPLMAMIKSGPIHYGVFEDEKLDFDDLYERFFKDAPKSRVYSKAISSRNFDAIGTHTCQIAFPGRYNDILVADKHYISLEPDFSNIDEVLEKLRDVSVWRTIVHDAYEMAIEHHTYAHRANQVFDIVSAL